eukprot:Hpha_TRINITY_DN23755_c0_g1::TRINITY_DN23755_c0_g1_i1::g.93148::m.93148
MAARDGFVVLAAAEMYGEKVNIEHSFIARPSLSELRALVQSTFGLEHAVSRPEGHLGPPFAVDSLNIYDDATGEWGELTEAAQLSNWCQVYVLQPSTPWHSETQKPLPPPQKPMRAALPDTSDPAEKARAVFDELDVNGDGVLEPEEVRRGFRTLGVGFDVSTVEDVFRQADRNMDGLVTPDEWQAFASLYPTLTDCLYYRSRDYWEDFRLQQSLRAVEALVEAGQEKKRQAELLRGQSGKDVRVHEERVRNYRAREKEATQGVRQLDQGLQQARNSADEAATARRRLSAEVERSREQERRHESTRRDAQQKCAEAGEVLRDAEGVLADHEARCKELAAALATAQQQAAMRRQMAESARKKLAAVQQKESQADSLLQKARRDTAARIEREHQSALDQEEATQRIGELRELLEEAASAAREQGDSVLQAEKELAEVKQRAGGRRTEEEAAEEELRGLQATLAEARQSHRDHRGRRKEVESQEQPLLQQELDLFRQRQIITERERELRSTRPRS